MVLPALATALAVLATGLLPVEKAEKAVLAMELAAVAVPATASSLPEPAASRAQWYRLRRRRELERALGEAPGLDRGQHTSAGGLRRLR